MKVPAVLVVLGLATVLVGVSLFSLRLAVILAGAFMVLAGIGAVDDGSGR